QIINNNPKALGVFGVCDQDLAALAKLKKDAPNSSWLVGTTAGADDPSSIPLLKSGALVGAVSQRGYVQGYVGMRLLIDIRTKGRAVTKGWINSGFDMIRQDNVDAFAAVLSSSDAGKQYYKNVISALIANPNAATKTPMSLYLTSANEPNPTP
nr:sugar ABC transporter substrate-binding protein [Actinomycetota bacterium]